MKITVFIDAGAPMLPTGGTILRAASRWEADTSAAAAAAAAALPFCSLSVGQLNASPLSCVQPPVKFSHGASASTAASLPRSQSEPQGSYAPMMACPVQQFIAAFNQRDLERMAGLLAPDCQYHNLGLPQAHSGKEVMNRATFFMGRLSLPASSSLLYNCTESACALLSFCTPSSNESYQRAKVPQLSLASH